jgi:predicted phage terminase large subunit-like protein
MENTYQEYQNKMLDRLNDGAKKILVGTLWSTNDPLMREEKLNEDNPRARFRKIPALDDNDKSNFDFEVKGFSSEYYIDMRNRLDKAEWMAKFQQRPFVREGLTFPVEELNYFDGTLPDGKCRTVAIVDCAFGGGDSLSMPIGKEFDDKRVFICGWVFDKRSPEFTVPRIVDAIIECDVSLLWIEKNSGGQFIAEKIQKELENRGIYGVKIELYSAPVRMHKEEKIVAYSGYVRSNFYFLRSTKHVESEIEMYVANEDYRKAMDEVTTWSAEGKKQHDDAPDSISSLAMKLENRIRNRKASVSRSWI